MKSASYRSASVTGSFADPGQSLPIRIDAGTHGDGELQVGDGPGPFARSRAGEGQPEVRVVVDGIDLHGLGELPASSSRPAREVQGPTEGLADRTLVGLEQLRLTEQHGRLVRVSAPQEFPSPLQELVGSAGPIRRPVP